MQHFKVVVFAIVVGSCVFEGEGLPAGDEETSSGSSNAIGGGITIEDDGTVKGLGPGIKFTVDSLAGPLSAARTFDTIQKAINLDLHKNLKNVDIAQVFLDLIVALSQYPRSGELNYETAIAFLQMFDTIPSKVIKIMKGVCFIIMKVKQAEDKNEVFDLNIEIPEAVVIFGGDINRRIELDWLRIAPKIYKAAKGDMDSAWEVVDFATDGFAALQGLKKQDDDDSELVTRALDRTVQFANLIKAKAGK